MMEEPIGYAVTAEFMSWGGERRHSVFGSTNGSDVMTYDEAVELADFHRTIDEDDQPPSTYRVVSLHAAPPAGT